MYSSPVVFPFVSVMLAAVGAFLIKLCFRRTEILEDHHVKHLHKDNKLRASYVSGRSASLVVGGFAVAVWLLWQLRVTENVYVTSLRPFYAVFGLIFMAQFLLAVTVKPFVIRNSSDTIDNLKAIIIVPVYNENEKSLKEGLKSFFYQTVLPTEIYIVDDGSRQSYAKTKRWFLQTAEKKGIVASWVKQKNAGKRAAHSTAFSQLHGDNQTIITTIDSDGVLDPDAIEEGLKPFTDPTVQSVAGLVIAKNAQHNLLARVTDLMFVSSQQLIDRAAMSQFGSVLVNSGGLAFYRYEVVRSAIKHGYTSEMFYGRHVQFSDDSFLTLFALLAGRTVQQPSSIVFADMPLTMSHHVRQQIRWNRGSFIRGWWRLRYLRINSVAWIRQLLGWAVLLAFSTALIQAVVLSVVHKKGIPIEIFVVPLMFGLLQFSRYFGVRRSDMSLFSQTLTFCLTPIAIIWGTVLFRALRLYGIVTCRRTGWGTRQQVEII